jgi:putative ABC transport system permease protein
VSWGSVLFVWWEELRERWVQELFAFVGIAVGVALLFAVLVSNSSLSATVGEMTKGVVGGAQFQLSARDAGGFSEQLVDKVQATAGVQAAAPVLEAQANVVGSKGERSVTLLAADARLAGLGGGLLRRAPTAWLGALDALVVPSGVAAGIGVRFGDEVQLAVAGRMFEVRAGAVVGHGDVGALAGAPVVVAPLRFAQALAGMEGRVSRIYVLARNGDEASVKASLQQLARDRLDVRPADWEERVFGRAALPNNQSTSLFATISAFVGFLFALNAMLLMMRERRALIADLRFSGVPMRDVLRVLLLDALVLGIVASLVGLALGELLSSEVFSPAPGYLTLAFPVGTARVVHLETILLAFLSGVGAAVGGTLFALRTVFSRPIDAIEDDDLDRGEDGDEQLLRPRRRPLAVGLACLIGSVIVLLAAPRVAMAGMLLVVFSMLFMLTAIVSAALTLADRLLRGIKSSVPSVAIEELRSNGTRSVTLAAIAAIAVCGSTAIEGAHHDLQNGLDRDVHELTAVTDLWLSPAGLSNALATTPFRPDVLPTIARLPHVVSVDIQRGGFLDIGDRRVWINAPPRTSQQPIPPNQIIHGNAEQATSRLRTGGWATVSEALADEQHLRIGQTFTLHAPRPTRLRLAAITNNLGWTPGAIIVNADDYRRAWNSDDASALHVRLDSEITPAQGKQLVADALPPAWRGLQVETAREREERQRMTARQGLARLTQIARLVLVAAAFAMAIAIGSMIWHRRPALADHKLGGASLRRVWKALLLETALLLSIGATTGAVFGLYGAQLLDRWLAALTGFPVQTSIAYIVAITCMATVTIIAFAIAAIPGYLAARVPTNAAFQD